MAFLRRRWTPEAAEEWTKEDWLAAILASLSYIFLAVGLALSLLLMWKGYLLFSSRNLFRLGDVLRGGPQIEGHVLGIRGQAAKVYL